MLQANLVLDPIIEDLPTRPLECLVVIANNYIGQADIVVYKQRPQDFENLDEVVFLFAAQQVVTKVKGRLQIGQTTNL